ncbi:unnamed protein product [Acanthoscelides obtectus]|uniref:Uncharacterized protein n=1 Tax=Acanthoscelides obtectus TaxID=200917 RepID=A0A9P0JVP7_ACAOB|nr:unnamed protein product [Acanthoscelides obtectus]CAK1666057.1 hypothetical protein AOBTE_LOCUS25133 [Acanthoscelides obtectus]
MTRPVLHRTLSKYMQFLLIKWKTMSLFYSLPYSFDPWLIIFLLQVFIFFFSFF